MKNKNSIKEKRHKKIIKLLERGTYLGNSEVKELSQNRSLS